MPFSLNRLIGSRHKVAFLFVIACLYGLGHWTHNIASNNWLPDVVIDPTLKKKNADGPLILKDDVLDKVLVGKTQLLQGAALLGDAKDLFDQPIAKVEPTVPTEIEPTEAFLEKFREKATKVANSTDNFVLFSVINEAYLNLTQNFLCNVNALRNGASIHKKMLLVALKPSTCKKIVKDWSTVTCVALEADSVHNEDISWGKKAYVQILNFRATLLLELAKLDISFILFESDSIWFRAPFELISNATVIDDADIIIPINGYTGKEQFAFDPLVAFNTRATIDFFTEMRDRLKASPDAMDQKILNELCATQYNGVVCRNFDWKDVADGKWFKMSERERKKFKPLIVNNNYYVGVKNKAARQALNGLWFLSPKGICNTSKAKKALAKWQ
uniref:Nucleotid_trans domain-containing protein n=1 Tax=Panagrellus redivivus TaxID=6233 RepID=A0A7E5A214_PANRE